MGSIKQLAGQTFWYGISSMGARFLNYLLTPYFTGILSGANYGEMTIAYAAIPFLNILFMYGLETAFFRFSKKGMESKVYNTFLASIIISTIGFTSLLFIFKQDVAELLLIPNKPEYIQWFALIVALDALTTLPFAKLRLEGRPIKFAMIKFGSILINIAAVIFFLSYLPALKISSPKAPVLLLYDEDMQVGYVILANLIQAFCTLLFLSREWLAFRWQIDLKLLKEALIYALPLAIAGLGGMVNETIDRVMLGWLLPYDSIDKIKLETGIYGAVYKLSLLITLFVQAFRMGAEPFFFKQAEQGNAERVYARVMKFFVITVTIMFLLVALYLDIWKQFLRNPVMWEGLKVVPILLFANIFLGIYYNLSIWYKLSGKTSVGAKITMIGASVTIVINLTLIPYIGYMASAWATFICYGIMMSLSYSWGQKAYPVPYATKKLVAYMVIVAALYFLHAGLLRLWDNFFFSFITASILLAAYCIFIVRIERKEFQKLPVIGKYLS